MNLILDTHVFPSAIGEPSRLSKKAAALLLDEGNELVLNVASLWEIALKVRTRKLKLPEDEQFFRTHLARLSAKPSD
jgi:PIN domain nuclease of toxin-antitoxin system